MFNSVFDTMIIAKTSHSSSHLKTRMHQHHIREQLARRKEDSYKRPHESHGVGGKAACQHLKTFGMYFSTRGLLS